MRRAVANTMGSMTISPASKKIGKPKISEATPGANGARFSPNIRISASASDCAPPDVSTKRPSIAPRPTRSATPPSVPPKFLTSTSLTMLPVGKPVAKAVSRLAMTSVSSARMRNLTIKIRMRMIAAAEMPTGFARTASVSGRPFVKPFSVIKVQNCQVFLSCAKTIAQIGR